jgi:nucleotide-binding universal stress UspA family protein
MATPSRDDRSVTRTYRAAVRLGEDFITLEETITLPIDASDDEVQQAVDLGWRIYRAQREAVDGQVATVREGHPAAPPITVRDPDSPASDKQRNYIATLQDNLSWNNEQLAGYAGEHGVDLVTMTKGQASSFIDGLKKLADERARHNSESKLRMVAEPAAEYSADERQPASERQIQALARLAHGRALDLDAETEQRYGVPSAQLSDDQARALLGEWQARPARTGGRKAESAL